MPGFGRGSILSAPEDSRDGLHRPLMPNPTSSKAAAEAWLALRTHRDRLAGMPVAQLLGDDAGRMRNGSEPGRPSASIPVESSA